MNEMQALGLAIAILLAGWGAQTGLTRIARALEDRNAIERRRVDLANARFEWEMRRTKP